MPKENPESIEEKMDLILIYLHRLDKRDRLRTWGGFLKGLLALIPIIILLWSTWYFIAHKDEIFKEITNQAAQSAASMFTGGNR